MSKEKKNNKNKEINNEPPEYITAREYSLCSAAERENWRAVPKKYERIPLFSKICFGISAVSLVIYILAVFSESFADFFNSNISTVFRFTLAKISNILPFSIGEFLFILLVPAAVGYIVFAIKCRSQTWKMVASSLSVPVSIVCIILSLFVLNLGTGYRTPTLDKKLNYEEVPVNSQNLYDSALYLIQNINALSEELEYDGENFSEMPYSFKEMNEKLLDAYDKFCEKNDIIKTFDSNLKPVLMSKPMSYMHTLGIYTFFTGEANINMDFPDYTIPYTSAHELAHQRGIAREDEANMIAFLVCMESDDAYIRYSAYLNMYEYTANALYNTDKELYEKAREQLHYKVKSEQTAYNNFFSQYYDSGASKISSTVNDTFLKIQGTQGEVSYSLVVKLAVAYFKTQNFIE